MTSDRPKRSGSGEAPATPRPGRDWTSAERLHLGAGLWVDARGVAWLARERALVVADVHFGYAWVQRQRGHLLPLGPFDDVAPRLEALQAEYRPRSIVFLGDLVHDACPDEHVIQPLRGLLERLAASSQLLLAQGNHDRRLARVAPRLGLPLEVEPEIRLGPHRLIHGDSPLNSGGQSKAAGARGCQVTARQTPPPAAADEAPRVRNAATLVRRSTRSRGSANGWLLLGHEHPALGLGDGVASAMRCPCFVRRRRSLILPAFSSWAAGGDVRRASFLSPAARARAWDEAIVCLGPRLLRIPLAELRR